VGTEFGAAARPGAAFGAATTSTGEAGCGLLGGESVGTEGGEPATAAAPTACGGEATAGRAGRGGRGVDDSEESTARAEDDVLWPDDDAPGRSAAHPISKALAKIPTAAPHRMARRLGE
jgi:hypothetical protein